MLYTQPTELGTLAHRKTVTRGGDTNYTKHILSDDNKTIKIGLNSLILHLLMILNVGKCAFDSAKATWLTHSLVIYVAVCKVHFHS